MFLESKYFIKIDIFIFCHNFLLSIFVYRKSNLIIQNVVTMPNETLDKDIQSSTKYAHFEPFIYEDLYSLYERHAEVARQIHEDSLRKFTGNSSLNVELVRENVLVANKSVLEKMSEYDVVSVSSELTINAVIFNYGLDSKSNSAVARDFINQNEMPIYVVSAGNGGRTGMLAKSRLADFFRNSLVVGEDTVSKDNVYVEEHSSKINPTLTCDSPFNHGKRYQYIDPNPSLAGHSDLIRDWLVKREIMSRFEKYKNDLPKELTNDNENIIYAHAYKEVMAEDFAQSKEVNDQIKAFMDNPQSLHDLVFPELLEGFKKYDLDDKGFLTGLDGTSFSAPEQAGCVSGAMYEQDMREEKGLPILTKEEITSLVKMATFDTQIRENADFPMVLDKNQSGHSFTYAGGHGIFSREMFRDLLDKAYEKIERDPNIDRKIVEIGTNAIIEPQDAHDKYIYNINVPEEKDVVIDRVRYDFDISRVEGFVPSKMVLNKNGEQNLSEYLQKANGDELGFDCWVRSETQFGETLKNGEKWEIEMPGKYEATTNSASITVYGYNKGGLMSQMMEYSLKIEQNYDPRHTSETKAEIDPNISGQEIKEQPSQNTTSVNMGM